MVAKPTEKQKNRLWTQSRSPNYRASSRLEEIDVETVTLDESAIAERIAALRSRYER